MKKEFDPQKHPWIASFLSTLFGIILLGIFILLYYVIPWLMEVNPLVFTILTILIVSTVIFRFFIFD